MVIFKFKFWGVRSEWTSILSNNERLSSTQIIFSNMDDGIQNKSPSLIRWIFAVIFLSLIGLTTGSVNLYPSQRESIQKALHISDGLTTFMLTGGVMIMYLTLPTGLFMDKFGSNITLFISVGLTIITYIILPFCGDYSWLFILLYLLMAFGSSSLFIACLQIVLSRSPQKIKSLSSSVVGASLSMSFGMFLEIYKAGKNAFKCTDDNCVFSSFKLVAIVVIIMICISAPAAYFLYRPFPQTGNKPSKQFWSIFLDYRLYLCLSCMFVTVFDGMIVLEAGDHIWKLYGSGYPNGASDWGIVFSIINCIMTITISALMDLIIAKYKSTRSFLFGTIWIISAFILISIAIIFNRTDDEILFGVFFSMLGIPFGLGLTQINALVSDIFGNDKYGFAFGVVQFGSIIASSSAMPILLKLNSSGILIIFLAFAALHIIIGGFFVFIKKKEKRELCDEPLLENSNSRT